MQIRKRESQARSPVGGVSGRQLEEQGRDEDGPESVDHMGFQRALRAAGAQCEGREGDVSIAQSWEPEMHTWQWKKSPRGQEKRGKGKVGSPERVEGAWESEAAAPAQGSWGRLPGAGEGQHWEGEDEAGTGAGSGQQRPESTKPGRVAWDRRG